MRLNKIPALAALIIAIGVILDPGLVRSDLVWICVALNATAILLDGVALNSHL